MIRIILILAIFSVGCSPDFETEGEFEASSEYEASFGGSPDDDVGGSQSDTGGDDQGGTGGDEQTSTGGVSGDTGGDTSTGGDPGTGGTDTIDEDCFSQWDPTVEYVYPAAVQVGDMIFETCGPATISTVGLEPVNTFGWQQFSCEGEWHYIGDCPSRNCGDAIDWDLDKTMSFNPPILAGTLFIYGGQIFETVSPSTFFLSTSGCPPNPDPEHWCFDSLGNSPAAEPVEPLVLAQQCL